MRGVGEFPWRPLSPVCSADKSLCLSEDWPCQVWSPWRLWPRRALPTTRLGALCRRGDGGTEGPGPSGAEPGSPALLGRGRGARPVPQKGRSGRTATGGRSHGGPRRLQTLSRNCLPGKCRDGSGALSESRPQGSRAGGGVHSGVPSRAEPAPRTPTRRAPGPLDVAPFGAAAYDVALTPEAVRRCPVKKTSVMFGGRKICLDLRYIGIYESESLIIITESGTHLMVPLNAARSAERGHREPSAAGPHPRLAVLCLLNNSSPASHGQERSRCKLWMRAPRRFVPSAPLASSSRAGRQSRLCQPGRLPLREKVH